MKKIIGLGLMVFSMIFVLGCDRCGQKEKPKEKDNSSSKPIEKVENPRETKEFEELKEKKEFVGEFSGVEYTITIYFDKDKAVNGVVTMICKDEQTAINLFSSHYNSADYDQVVRNKNLVSYDYNERSFVYANKNKEEVTAMIEGQGFKEKK